MRAVVLILVAGAAALAHGLAAAAGPADSYATDLGRVYGGYQRILAQKDACDAAVPAARAAHDKAFASWETQNRALVQDLQRRVTEMIRRASTSQDEYVRNLGKYEGAILQEREGYRETLLALGAEELRAQCKGLPEALTGAGTDLATVYAAELETIRKRKGPSGRK